MSAKTKTYSACGVPKPLDDFYRLRRGEESRQSHCKICQNVARGAPRAPHAYATNGSGQMSYDEIARRVGLSREGVRLVERRALRKLRGWLALLDAGFEVET